AAAVDHGGRVHVDVDDPGGRGDLARDLVHGALGRDARAEIEELANAFAGHHPYRPAQERPVQPHDLGQLRHGGDRLGGHRPVGGEVVGTAEVAVVDPGRAGPVGVDAFGWGPGLRHTDHYRGD